MISKTPKSATVSITQLTADPRENHRFYSSHQVLKGINYKVDTYDIPGMQHDIVASLRIERPLTCEKRGDKYHVGQGFRRFFAALGLWEIGEKSLKKLAEHLEERFPDFYYVRGEYSPDHKKGGDLLDERTDRDPMKDAKELMDALKHIPVTYYEGLTPSEWSAVKADKGTEKRIRRAETLRMIWDLADSGLPEKDIARATVHQLADYTGNRTILDELASLKDAKERDRRLTKWTHGTLGGFILDVWGWDSRMRNNLMLTELLKDGMIKTRIVEDAAGQKSEELEMKPEFKLTHKRWRDLMAAYRQDEAEGNWDGKKLSGPRYDKLCKDYAEADWKGKALPRGSNRPDEKRLLQFTRQDYCDPVSKEIFEFAATGKEPSNLKEMLGENLRRENVFKVLSATADNLSPKAHLSSKEFNHILRAVVTRTVAPAELQKILEPFLTKEGVKAVAAATAEPEEATEEAKEEAKEPVGAGA